MAPTRNRGCPAATRSNHCHKRNGKRIDIFANALYVGTLKPRPRNSAATRLYDKRSSYFNNNANACRQNAYFLGPKRCKNRGTRANHNKRLIFLTIRPSRIRKPPPLVSPPQPNNGWGG